MLFIPENHKFTACPWLHLIEYFLLQFKLFLSPELWFHLYGFYFFKFFITTVQFGFCFLEIIQNSHFTDTFFFFFNPYFNCIFLYTLSLSWYGVILAKKDKHNMFSINLLKPDMCVSIIFITWNGKEIWSLPISPVNYVFRIILLC